MEDRISTPEVIMQKLVEVLERKSVEIDERNLTRVNDKFGLICKEVERLMQRNLGTNFENEGLFVRPSFEREQIENQVLSDLETMRQD